MSNILVADAKQIIKEQILHQPVIGVYVLLLECRIVYIGQSTNIARRIAQHAAGGKIEFDASWVHACRRNELDDVENAYIATYLPARNTAMTVEARALAKKLHSKPYAKVWQDNQTENL